MTESLKDQNYRDYSSTPIKLEKKSVLDAGMNKIRERIMDGTYHNQFPQLDEVDDSDLVVFHKPIIILVDTDFFMKAVYPFCFFEEEYYGIIQATLLDDRSDRDARMLLPYSIEVDISKTIPNF